MLGSEARLAAPEVAALEVEHVGVVDGPVVAAAVARLAHLHEALVEREVVADAVAPALVRAVPVVGKVGDDPVVDLVEQDLALRPRQDGHGDEGDVGVGRTVHVQRRILRRRAAQKARVAARLFAAARQLQLLVRRTRVLQTS